MDAVVSRHLAGVSRTYAIVVPMLPGDLANAVGLAYLVMRAVDTLEDAPELDAAKRLHLFDALQASLCRAAPPAEELTQPIGESEDERALMQDLPAVFERVHGLSVPYRGSICECARNMMDGCRALIRRSAEREQTYPAVRDISELREYCYYVAGVVGEMLCAMMAEYLGDPAFGDQRTNAIELGLGLQMTNIVKDWRKDAGHGRRYLPQADADGEARVYREVLAEAERCLRRGMEYVLALPGSQPGLRRFSGLPLVWAALTLEQAGRDPERAKIDRAALVASVARFDEVVADDAALRGWMEGLLVRR